METRLWYLVFYDVRDPSRWRKAYRIIRGTGERVQYSVFRCRMNERQREHLRWSLEQVLATEDSLLIVGLCDVCLHRVQARNGVEDWEPVPEVRFRIL